MIIVLEYAIALLASFSAVLASCPLLIRSAWKHNVLERDSNKSGKPQVAGLGGFSLYGGLAAGILCVVLYQVFLANDTAHLGLLLAGLASISILSLIGIFDDVFKLSRSMKSILPLIGSFPLLAVKAGKGFLSFPFIKTIHFGLAYNLILVPLGVTGAANAVNMSAGYNGLEAGIGAVASFFLILIGLQAHAPLAGMVILFACLGACLAFLLFNFYPAKVFPGDIGTLAIGAGIAAGVILCGLEEYGAIILLPAFYELTATVYYSLKGVERRSACHNPVIRFDGKLTPPKGAENYTLFYKILSKKPMTERNLVLVALSIYSLCGLIALAVYYF